MKIDKQILAHVKSLKTTEAVQNFYGVGPRVAERALKGTITMAFVGPYLEAQQQSPAQQQIAAATHEAEAGTANGGAGPTDMNLLSDPVIQQIVAKLNESTEEHNSLLSVVEELKVKNAANEDALMALHGRLSALELLVPEPSSGGQPTHGSTHVPVSNSAVMNGDHIPEAYEISQTRPSPVLNAPPARPAQPAPSSHPSIFATRAGARPAPAPGRSLPAPGAVPSPAAGGFDFLSPHGKVGSLKKPAAPATS